MAEKGVFFFFLILMKHDKQIIQITKLVTC